MIESWALDRVFVYKPVDFGLGFIELVNLTTDAVNLLLHGADVGFEVALLLLNQLGVFIEKMCDDFGV